MKYVVDASVEVKTFVTEVDSDKAIRLREDSRNGIHELLAPDLFPTELCNVLMILERGGKLQLGEAHTLFLKSLREPTTIHEDTPLLPRALEIAQNFRQSVYDSLYSALAEQEGCEHVTADDKYLRAVQKVLPFVIPLSSLPS